MADKLSELMVRLQCLIKEAEREIDPDKADMITEEMWRVMAECDRIRGTRPPPKAA